MKETKKPNTLSQFFNRLRDPKKKRTFRITYHVIWNLILLFIILGGIGAAFAGGIGAGYFASLVKDEPIRSKEELSKDIYNYEETSELYFANNVYLGKLRTDLEREEVPLEEMSKYLRNAVIATEDEYFYKHDGVVPKAVFRAVFQEMTNSAVQSGGSTLTQQLIKQQVLTNEVSFQRKANEILLALRLEKFFDKDDILEAYLNISPFGRNSSGRNIAGVQAAAEGIFGVDAKDLNLAQSAYIAGLPQSPFGYTPFTNQGKLKENLEPGLNRQKIVLSRMYSGGFITEKEYNEALDYDVTKDFTNALPPAFEKYPFLTTEVEQRSIQILSAHLAKEDGYTEADLKKDKNLGNKYVAKADKAIRQNGYKIHTTINKDMYDAMDNVTKNFSYYGPTRQREVTDPETKETKTVPMPVETGSMLIENKTGKILSFVGGRDFNRMQLNHATGAYRSNGSTMKPLLVYAPAIELGTLAPGTLAIDGPINIHGWQPKNYGGGYSGLTSARKALKYSQNTPAAQFYMDIINQRPAKFLEKMGFTSLTPGDYENPAASIGSLGKGVTVEENTNAYATLANNGQFVDAYMIEKIETKKGEIVYQHKSEPVKVFSPTTAYLTIDMMRDVVNSGTAASVRGRLNFYSDFAGKTGTGNHYSDAWFVASNPNVTLGVWNGYDLEKSLDIGGGLSYSKRNQYLWADYMNALYKVDKELIGTKKRFQSPGGFGSRSYASMYNLPSDLLAAAGISSSDLFPSNYSAKLGNATTANGKFVVIGGKRYLALPTTPAEFTESGAILSPDFVKLIGSRWLISNSIDLGGSNSGAEQLSDNGRAPYALSITASGNTISWNGHGDGDVIGYRVYKDNRKVASIKVGQALTFSGGAGSYIVKAVDIAGNESPASNVVTIGGGKTETTPPTTDSTKPDSKPGTDTNPGTGTKPNPNPGTGTKPDPNPGTKPDPNPNPNPNPPTTPDQKPEEKPETPPTPPTPPATQNGTGGA
ncbi:transglycosylase domain-containing protein [Bacillus massiliigorillae]|uniref:transglycosylase domain-containing protein n=1 Tax=Bacillus massiliigorillae TaxID=1243664 RepID=UPI00039DED59|nr:transglycosylase domain-containing protein [Bacillus massiliigorillae]